MFAIAAILFIAVGVRFKEHTGSWVLGVLGALVFVAVGGIFFVPMIAFAILGSLAALGAVFDALAIEPLAWLLERDEFDRWVKVTSLALLLIGFHFDLLIS